MSSPVFPKLTLQLPSTLGISCDVLGRAIHVAHKYNAEQVLQLGTAWLRELPSTVMPAKTVYRHPKWPLYHTPSFCLSIIRTAALLDMRELDETSALAYCTLSTVNWNAYHQGEVMKDVSPVILARLASGHHKLFDKHAAIIKDFIDYNMMHCFRHQPRSCREAGKPDLKALTLALDRDFIAALVGMGKRTEGSCDFEFPNPLKAAVDAGFSGVCKTFGFV